MCWVLHRLGVELKSRPVSETQPPMRVQEGGSTTRWPSIMGSLGRCRLCGYQRSAERKSVAALGLTYVRFLTCREQTTGKKH